MASTVLYSVVDTTNPLISSTLAVLSSSTYSVFETWQSSVLWMLVLGFVIAFILAFAVGANDVANSFGTTVGAGTLSLFQACVLASVFETLGAILLGAKVGTTIRKGIIDVDIYHGKESTLMAGEISAMLASGIWQLIATFFKMPVSGTHSIVGATIGFSLVARGAEGVQWEQIGLIVGSWFLSPVLAGIMAAGFYYLLRIFIFQKDEPVRPGLIALPIMYGFTVAINFFSVFLSETPLLQFDQLSYVAKVLISLGIGILIGLGVQLVFVRRMKKSFKSMQSKQPDIKPVVSVAPSSLEAKKSSKLPAVLETISEKETPDGSNCKLEDQGPLDCKKSENLEGNTTGHQQHNSDKVAAESGNQRIRFQSLRSDVTSGRTIEEAKLLRHQTSKRSKSFGLQQSHSSSGWIPPVLQLERNVLKANVPIPTPLEIRDEIRRNFSEPAMISMTQHSDADVYEVFINRQRKLVTIQRKGSSMSETGSRPRASQNEAKVNGSEQELEKLLSNISPDMKLDDPFDESDEDGGLNLTAPLSTEPYVPSMYSDAIEEGFRRLSTSPQNIIAIKIGDDVEEGGRKPEKLSKDGEMEAKEGRMEIRKMFSFLQILTACFGSFAHGGNDVSNAIGPLIAIWIIYNEGGVQQKSATPLWILLYGGVGICLGLWVWGRRVIKTMGNDLTNLTPSRGFAIELMSAITVLMASNVGLPVSTTHCKVGAVVAVGWVRARKAVDWKIFRNIVLAWFVTLPVSGVFSAIIFALFRAIVDLS